MKFCYIAPASLLDLTENISSSLATPDHRAHLILAHLLDRDGPDFNAQYADWYRSRTLGDRLLKILDNSAFELVKQGRPLFNPDKLIDLAYEVGANYVVMSDYPGEPAGKTIAAAHKQAPEFRRAGLGTFFVPQSEVGNVEEYISCFAWAATSPLVDYIGVSILGVPNAYGVESGNKLQRYLSRYVMMHILKDRGILEIAKHNNKRIHFLGMVDGPKEIDLVKNFTIDSWDSSAPIWYAANGIEFDNSPTGAINGKFEKHVDFSAVYTDTELLDIVARLRYNIRFINEML